MRRRGWILALFFAACAPDGGGAQPAPTPSPTPTPSPSPSHPTGPAHVASGEPQLFVDDELIAHAEGLERRLIQPRKEGGGDTPVVTLPADAFSGYPFTLEATGSIL